MRKGETEEIVLAVLSQYARENPQTNFDSIDVRKTLAARVGCAIDTRIIQGLVEDIIIPSK